MSNRIFLNFCEYALKSSENQRFSSPKFFVSQKTFLNANIMFNEVFTMKKTRFKIENMEPDFIERLLDDKDEVYRITDFIRRLALKEFFERHNLIELENLTKHNNDFKKVCPPHDRCLLKSGLEPIYGCRICRLPEDKWEDKPIQKS